MDGGSQDESVEIARRLLLDTDVIVSEADEGQSDAIQKGLERARGTWFIFQNSDDLFNIATLDRFLDEAEQYDRFDVVAFDMDVIEADGANGWKVVSSFRHTRPVSWRQLRYNIYYTNQATVYRTSVAKRVKFDPAMGFALDYDFVVRFFKLIRPKVKIVSAVMGYQRMHDDTKTSKLQELCLEETRAVRRREYGSTDSFVGFLEMVQYHAFKKLRLW